MRAATVVAAFLQRPANPHARGCLPHCLPLPHGRERVRTSRLDGFGRRLAVATIWALAFLGILAGRLAIVQIVHHRLLSADALQEHLRAVPLPAVRDEITDPNGQVLAVSLPAATGTVDPRLTVHRTAAAAALSPILGQPAAQILKVLRGPGQYAVLSSQISSAQASAVGSGRRRLFGVGPTYAIHWRAMKAPTRITVQVMTGSHGLASGLRSVCAR